MTGAAWCILLAAWLGQIAASPGAPGQPPPMVARPPAEPEQQVLMARVVAVQATSEGRDSPFFDDGLKPYREMLKRLSFDTFRKVAEQEREAPFGAETCIDIDDVYSLTVTPSPNPETGEILLEARVDMLEGEGAVKALYGTAKASLRKPLLFAGLESGDGELAVVLTFDQGDQDSNSQQQPEPQEDEEQEDEDEQEQPQPEEQDSQQQSPPEEAEEQEPKELEDLQNIEALLQSLEDTDRREQAETKNQRDRVRIQKDWW